MTLRENFYKECSDKSNSNLELFLKSDEQNYIIWLENKIHKQNN